MDKLIQLINEALQHEPDVIVHASNRLFSHKQKMKHNITFTHPIVDNMDREVKDASTQHKELGKQRGKLPTVAGNTLYRYTVSSTGVNGHLINKTNNPSRAGQSKNISNVIQAHAKPLKQDTHVYAGLGRFDPSEAMKTGVFHTPAFTSTSLSSVIGASFLKPGALANPLKDSHMLHFHLPAGYNKGISLHKHSHWNGESEYLLDKDQKWKVQNHETRDLTSEHKLHIWTVVPHEG